MAVPSEWVPRPCTAVIMEGTGTLSCSLKLERINCTRSIGTNTRCSKYQSGWFPAHNHRGGPEVMDLKK